MSQVPATSTDRLTILLVEDNPGDVLLTRELLAEVPGSDVELKVADRLASAFAQLADGRIDVVLLDLTLVEPAGLETFNRFYARAQHLPIVVLSGLDDEALAMQAVKSGAQDYLVKGTSDGRLILRAVRYAIERKRVEETLREREEFFRLVSDSMNDLVAVIDRDGTRLYNSPSYGSILGDPKLLVGSNSFEKIHPDDRQRIQQIFRETVATGVGRRTEYRYLLPDGAIRHVESQGSVIQDETGQTAKVVVVSRDITERKRAEEEIREKAALLDLAQDAIFTVDLEGRLGFWNKGAERLYGWTAAEVAGQNVARLLHRVAAEVQEALARLVETGKWSGELGQLTKGGKEVTVSSRWTLVQDAQGRPRSVLVINTDITEKKKLEAQFLRAQRMESIGTLAGGVAHDLNNVLAPILMSAEILGMRTQDQKSRALIATISSTAERGAAIVKQLLSYARGVEGARISVAPVHLCRELLKILQGTFPKNIEIQTFLPADLWPVIGDSTQLYQVLLNLCVNARDALPEGGRLQLTAENQVLDEHYVSMNAEARSGPHVMIQVADSGTGIPAAVREQIFDPFFTTKEPGKGTGLGLSTVLSIVKNHGGFLTVHSDVGKGTEFKVFLPAAPGAVTAGQDGSPAPARGRGELILLADDEAHLRDLTQRTLELHGYRTLTAADGAEALARYSNARGEVRAVVTDLAMPVMDGLALVRELRRMSPQVRIIISTGQSIVEQRSELQKLGVNSFLAKPYTGRCLLTTLQQELGAQE